MQERFAVLEKIIPWAFSILNIRLFVRAIRKQIRLLKQPWDSFATPWELAKKKLIINLKYTGLFFVGNIGLILLVWLTIFIIVQM